MAHTEYPDFDRLAEGRKISREAAHERALARARMHQAEAKGSSARARYQRDTLGDLAGAKVAQHKAALAADAAMINLLRALASA